MDQENIKVFHFIFFNGIFYVLLCCLGFHRVCCSVKLQLVVNPDSSI
jgi:hypothetical protein